MEKANKVRVTLTLNLDDPLQKLVADYLNEMGRRKSKVAVHALYAPASLYFYGREEERMVERIKGELKKELLNEMEMPGTQQEKTAEDSEDLDVDLLMRGLDMFTR